MARTRSDQSIPNASQSWTGAFTTTRVSAEGLIGLTIGLVWGAVGLILGSIRPPAMIRILRVDPKIAAGTNLLIWFFMGSVGWVGHAVQGDIDYQLLLLMGSSAMAGSYYDARLTGKVNLDSLLRMMGWVLLVVGILLVWGGVA